MEVVRNVQNPSLVTAPPARSRGRDAKGSGAAQNISQPQPSRGKAQGQAKAPTATPLGGVVTDMRAKNADGSEQTALTEAILGRKTLDISMEEFAQAEKVIEEAMLLKNAPKVITVPAAPNAGKGAALPPGVDAAFIPGKNVILVRGGLSGSERKAALREEFGEYLAGRITQSGIKVGPGDAGARFEKALAGKPADRNDTVANKTDTAFVRYQGKTYTAKARARPARVTASFETSDPVELWYRPPGGKARKVASKPAQTPSASGKVPVRNFDITDEFPSTGEGAFELRILDKNAPKGSYVVATTRSEYKGRDATSTVSRNVGADGTVQLSFNAWGDGKISGLNDAGQPNAVGDANDQDLILTISPPRSKAKKEAPAPEVKKRPAAADGKADKPAKPVAIAAASPEQAAAPAPNKEATPTPAYVSVKFDAYYALDVEVRDPVTGKWTVVASKGLGHTAEENVVNVKVNQLGSTPPMVRVRNQTLGGAIVSGSDPNRVRVSTEGKTTTLSFEDRLIRLDDGSFEGDDFNDVVVDVSPVPLDRAAPKTPARPEAPSKPSDSGEVSARVPVKDFQDDPRYISTEEYKTEKAKLERLKGTRLGDGNLLAARNIDVQLGVLVDRREWSAWQEAEARGGGTESSGGRPADTEKDSDYVSEADYEKEKARLEKDPDVKAEGSKANQDLAKLEFDREVSKAKEKDARRPEKPFMPIPEGDTKTEADYDTEDKTERVIGAEVRLSKGDAKVMEAWDETKGNWVEIARTDGKTGKTAVVELNQVGPRAPNIRVRNLSKGDAVSEAYDPKAARTTRLDSGQPVVRFDTDGKTTTGTTRFDDASIVFTGEIKPTTSVKQVDAAYIGEERRGVGSVTIETDNGLLPDRLGSGTLQVKGADGKWRTIASKDGPSTAAGLLYDVSGKVSFDRPFYNFAYDLDQGPPEFRFIDGGKDAIDLKKGAEGVDDYERDTFEDGSTRETLKAGNARITINNASTPREEGVLLYGVGSNKISVTAGTLEWVEYKDKNGEWQRAIVSPPAFRDERPTDTERRPVVIPLVDGEAPEVRMVRVENPGDDNEKTIRGKAGKLKLSTAASPETVTRRTGQDDFFSLAGNDNINHIGLDGVTQPFGVNQLRSGDTFTVAATKVDFKSKSQQTIETQNPIEKPDNPESDFNGINGPIDLPADASAAERLQHPKVRNYVLEGLNGGTPPDDADLKKLEKKGVISIDEGELTFKPEKFSDKDKQAIVLEVLSDKKLNAEGVKTRLQALGLDESTQKKLSQTLGDKDEFLTFGDHDLLKEHFDYIRKIDPDKEVFAPPRGVSMRSSPVMTRQADAEGTTPYLSPGPVFFEPEGFTFVERVDPYSEFFDIDIWMDKNGIEGGNRKKVKDAYIKAKAGRKEANENLQKLGDYFGSGDIVTENRDQIADAMSKLDQKWEDTKKRAEALGKGGGDGRVGQFGGVLEVTLDGWINGLPDPATRSLFNPSPGTIGRVVVRRKFTRDPETGAIKLDEGFELVWKNFRFGATSLTPSRAQIIERLKKDNPNRVINEKEITDLKNLFKVGPVKTTSFVMPFDGETVKGSQVIDPSTVKKSGDFSISQYRGYAFASSTVKASHVAEGVKKVRQFFKDPEDAKTYVRRLLTGFGQSMAERFKRVMEWWNGDGPPPDPSDAPGGDGPGGPDGPDGPGGPGSFPTIHRRAMQGLVPRSRSVDQRIMNAGLLFVGDYHQTYSGVPIWARRNIDPLESTANGDVNRQQIDEAVLEVPEEEPVIWTTDEGSTVSVNPDGTVISFDPSDPGGGGDPSPDPDPDSDPSFMQNAFNWVDSNFVVNSESGAGLNITLDAEKAYQNGDWQAISTMIGPEVADVFFNVAGSVATPIYHQLLRLSGAINFPKPEAPPEGASDEVVQEYESELLNWGKNIKNTYLQQYNNLRLVQEFAQAGTYAWLGAKGYVKAVGFSSYLWIQPQFQGKLELTDARVVNIPAAGNEKYEIGKDWGKMGRLGIIPVLTYSRPFYSFGTASDEEKRRLVSDGVGATG